MRPAPLTKKCGVFIKMIKKISIAILFIAAMVYLPQNKLSAKRLDRYDTPPDVPQIEPIKKEDRILIFAPHPDDETLGTAGIIQKAVAAGAQVRVMYLTNGEHNQLAFIVYEKRFVIKQKALIEMGELRRREAIAAMGLLGVPEENLIFLGYPDFGTMAIFLKYWGDIKPFKNMLTRIARVPYEDSLTPNALYKGESILWDIESVLRKYKPTRVFVTNPVDTNRDHRAAYLFLQVALWDLKGQIPEPKICPYLIHCYSWPLPRNYHPGLYINIPKLLEKSPIIWQSSDLSNKETEKKYEAVRLYKSQCADSAFYLTAFARRNELFGKYPDIELGAADTVTDNFKIATTFQHKTVVYGREGDNFMINVFIKRDSSNARNFYATLAGYRHDVEFAQMPKIKINVNNDSIKVSNGGRFIKSEAIRLEQKKYSVVLMIPFKILGDPESILASVNTYTGNSPSDLNAWRVIRIK